MSVNTPDSNPLSNLSPEELERRWSALDGGPQDRLVTAVVVGCGMRGQGYANFALDFPKRLKIVGIAEPIERRRNKMKRLHQLEDHQVFASWEDLANKEKLADCAIIGTQDRMHLGPAVAFARKGYHLLLEKPMSVEEEECDSMAKVFEETGVIVAVCHVLRYFPPVTRMRQAIDAGLIGDVVSITHVENVGFWHFAHSFVRGNWRSVAGSTFSLLAKCCHDLDLVMYWMGDRKCTKIQSFGGLYHFKADQAPKNATSSCRDCPAETECPYSAKKIYLERCSGEPRWPMKVVCDVEDDPRGYRAALEEALWAGPYGRCVYKCDNDVADHQTVNMEFENGATATVTMNGHSRAICRETKICGTRGELRWEDDEKKLYLFDFTSMKETPLELMFAPDVRTRGHGGADFFLMSAFCKAVASGDAAKHVKTGVVDSLRSHKLTFAAERSRVNGTIETINI